MTQLFEKAAGLYRGHFLPSDADHPWTASMRGRLRNRYLSVLGKAGSYCEEQKQWDKAIEWYRQGIETDGLAEEFYQRLMLCYQKQGKTTEAVKIYHSCRSMLSDNFDIVPSSKTAEIYKSIVKK